MAVFDIFQIENGKIIGQWDKMEPIPLRVEWVNTGKFSLFHCGVPKQPEDARIQRSSMRSIRGKLREE
ncbi:hypothetical protein K6Q96_08200 [Grimontia kaedaensis]|uniref:Uncharacterized protein n=1 Tax=Grimontia kaedaensis TaxID=2872157 RepID=A0ABY4WY96_9GAMM|nr:hypothetical protein [Grimontia kaedaensis]USH03956.1 hypothetical protein K6Q96_08200 [Grimontia kaedaensis]